jgi:hypothetical protein
MSSFPVSDNPTNARTAIAPSNGCFISAPEVTAHHFEPTTVDLLGDKRNSGV